MATRLHLRRSRSTTMPTEDVMDMLPPAGPGVGADFQMNVASGNTDVQWKIATGSSLRLAFVSERIAAPVTISGAITVQVYAYEVLASINATVRVRVSKITAGGSAVETSLGSADGTAEMVLNDTGLVPPTQFTLTVTPPVAVDLVANERLIVRVYAIPYGVGSLGAGGLGMRVGAASAGVGYAYAEFTETITFLANATRLLLRRTQDTGIGSVLDMTTTRGSSAYLTAATRVMGSTTVPLVTNAIDRIQEVSGSGQASTANASTYVSPSTFTPVADLLYLLAVCHSDAAPETTVPTVTTTTGLNFVQVGSSIAFDTIASNVHRVTLFRAMKSSGLVNGTYTVTLADAGTGCAAILLEVSGGAVTTGSDGADAVRNIVTNAADATADPNVTFGTFLQTYNAAVVCIATDSATQPTPDATWNELGAQIFKTYATPTTGLSTQNRWYTTGASTVGATLAASDWGAIGVEVVAKSQYALEFISPRFKAGWTYVQDDLAAAELGLWIMESNGVADIQLEYRLYRWRAGVETLCSTGHLTPELGVDPTVITTRSTLAGGTVTQTYFLPDDRMILRLYAVVSGTLPGYLARVDYDHSVAGVRGDSYLDLYDGPLFKAESDPAEPTRITSGLTMGGVGN